VWLIEKFVKDNDEKILVEFKEKVIKVIVELCEVLLFNVFVDDFKVKIEVMFDIDVNGIVYVLVKDCGMGKE